MKFGQFKSFYKRKNFLEKLQIPLPENQFQTLLCLERIKHNLYWKMKFVKQATCITVDM